MGTTDNSSGTSGTSAIGFGACCHGCGQVKSHWDRPDIKLCGPCHHLLFHTETHGSIANAVHAFFLRMEAGQA